jgi:hypothetical protein
MLPIVIIGVALFLLAYVGINQFFPTAFGLGAAVGLIFGFYFIWQGVSRSNGTTFGWGCVLMIVSGGVLIFLKTSFGD